MTRDDILIWLMGGLGNQLFQLNKAYQLKNLGFNVSLVNNLIDSKHFIIQKILGWKIHENIIDNIYEHEFRVVTSKHYFPIVFAKAPFLNSYSTFSGIKFKSNYSKNLFGYFQHNVVIQLPLKNFKSYKKKTHTLVMHIRLKDNNNISYSTYFYEKVLDVVRDKKITVVTDDKKTAKLLLAKKSILNYRISKGDVVEHFKSLSNADILVCAPSTFSFWAAISNVKASKIYVPVTFSQYIKEMPKNWQIL